MRVSDVDKGNYYRGLLVLARRDRILDLRERELMLKFGATLDFDRRFCQGAIDDLMENRHISDEPVTFAERTTAEQFLRDGIELAFSDEAIHTREHSWLLAVARANGLTNQWLEAEIHRYMERKDLPCAPAPNLT